MRGRFRMEGQRGSNPVVEEATFEGRRLEEM